MGPVVRTFYTGVGSSLTRANEKDWSWQRSYSTVVSGVQKAFWKENER